MKVCDMEKSCELAYKRRAFIQTMTFIEGEHTTCHWTNIRKCDGSFKWVNAVSFQTFDFVTSSRFRSECRHEIIFFSYLMLGPILSQYLHDIHSCYFFRIEIKPFFVWIWKCKICIKWANIVSQGSLGMSLIQIPYIINWYYYFAQQFLLQNTTTALGKSSRSEHVANCFKWLYKIWKCMQRIPERKQKYVCVIKYASFLIAYARFYAKRVFYVCRKTIAKRFPSKKNVM